MRANNKLRLYKSIIRHQMHYACQIWDYARPSLNNSLQRIQNRFLRIIFDALWFVRNDQLHRDVNLPRIKEHILDTAVKFFASVVTHPSQTIRPTNDSYAEDSTSGPRR